MITKILQVVVALKILFTPFTLEAEAPDQQRAFYAVSSLRYYLEAANPSDQAAISEADISALWAQALSCEGVDQIVAAKQCFDQSLSPSPDALAWKACTLDYLTRAWEALNPYWDSDKPYTAKKCADKKYLLPKKSPLRGILKDIFPDQTVYETPESFLEAGFIPVSTRPSGMCVAKHPKLPGHLVKVYIRSKKIKPNWQWLVYRCWGASNIRSLIKEKKLNYFVVPNKWIYPLESTRLPRHLLPADLKQVDLPAVLVVSDMQLVDRETSRIAWKERVTKRHIEELYCILSHGFSSCCLPSNIPYTQCGKFACIDTEHPTRRLPYDHVGRYLSDQMAEYFDYLVRTGGRGVSFYSGDD